MEHVPVHQQRELPSGEPGSAAEPGDGRPAPAPLIANADDQSTASVDPSCSKEPDSTELPSCSESSPEMSVPPMPETLAEVSNRDLRAEIDRVQQSIALLGERSRADQDLIGRMQARIEALQVDQVRALLGPVITELAGAHAAFIEASQRDYEVLGVARLRKEFALLGDRIEGALDLLGAVSVGATPGEAFDSRRHTAVRRTMTARADLDKTIAEVLRQGFVYQHDAKVAVYARVAVYKYDSALSAAPDDPESAAACPPSPPAGEASAGCSDDASPGSVDLSPDSIPVRIPLASDKE